VVKYFVICIVLVGLLASSPAAQLVDPEGQQILRGGIVGDRYSNAYFLEVLGSAETLNGWLGLSANQVVANREIQSQVLLGHAQAGVNFIGVTGVIVADAIRDLGRGTALTIEVGGGLERELYRTDTFTFTILGGLLGQNEAANTDALRELGYTEEEIEDLEQSGVTPRWIAILAAGYRGIGVKWVFKPHATFDDLQGSIDLNAAWNFTPRLGFNVGWGIDFDSEPLTDKLLTRYTSGFSFTF